MPRDLADELITIRRALPSDVSRAVRFGADPTEGMVLVVPEDPAWQLTVRPTPTGWAVSEVHDLPTLPIASLATGSQTVPTATAPDSIAELFRRLQLRVRNAACGTGVDAAVNPSRP